MPISEFSSSQNQPRNQPIHRLDTHQSITLENYQEKVKRKKRNLNIY